MMLTDIFPNPSSKPAQELARLGARRRELLAQERDELSALETARAEHARLERVIADSEAKALALGQDTPKAKAGPKLEKLAREVDARTEESDKLGRALLMLDEEARNLVTVHADELVAEAIAAHDHARERLTELGSLASTRRQQRFAVHTLRFKRRSRQRDATKKPHI